MFTRFPSQRLLNKLAAVVRQSDTVGVFQSRDSLSFTFFVYFLQFVINSLYLQSPLLSNIWFHTGTETHNPPQFGFPYTQRGIQYKVELITRLEVIYGIFECFNLLHRIFRSLYLCSEGMISSSLVTNDQMSKWF